MTDTAIHDQKRLREEAYADDSCLDVRYRTHQLYTVDPVDFGRWTLERLAWRGGEWVLDMGCGPGGLLIEMARRQPTQSWGALVGFDLSPGMVMKASRSAANLPVRFYVGDAQDFPLSSGWFDVVMARHMLYHVPDIDRAVAEAARVLRPGGQFLALTNSADTMPELWELRRRAASRFPRAMLSQEPPHRFTLENATDILSPHLRDLEIHILPGTLRFPTAEPLMAYFASMRSLIMESEHAESEWQAVLAYVHEEVAAVITREGRFDVTKVTGAIVGVKGN